VVTAAVDGMCDSHFRLVHDAFAENFAQHGEVGASVAVTVDGKPVVDLWAGHAAAARTRPWTRDAIVNIASTTKGLTAICAHHLVDRGLLDLDTPVAAYRPEFAQAGKTAIPVHFSSAIAPACPRTRVRCASSDALYMWL
jgi:CubicO group peptidase (beta-lactamase class C family)